MKKKFVIIDEEGERLDKYLSSKFLDISRNQIGKAILEGLITVNSKIVKPSYKVQNGDQIMGNIGTKSFDVEPKASSQISLEIIYEDQNVIVINKQPGIVVHPAAGHKEGTLVNALIAHYPQITEAVYDKNNEVSINRPGLVHRLDRDTSGVIIIAKNARAMHSLAKQIQNRTVTKKYIALCYGWPQNHEGILINYLGRHPKNRKLIADVGQDKGREAISHYTVLEYFKFQNVPFSLIEFDIKTGRTHQIRVQASKMGHPVIGDEVYGNKQSKVASSQLSASRQLLHAKSLTISLPGDKTSSTFTAPVPKDFNDILFFLEQSKVHTFS